MRLKTLLWRSPLGLALLFLTAASPARLVAAPQNGTTSREQAGLVEEQELLSRKLARIVGSMQRLADQYEAEGRVHGAALLREGLAHISKRSEEAGGLSLLEMMTGTRESLAAGQSMQSIKHQEELVKELNSLLSILMDRPDLEELESELQRLEKRRLALEGLASKEQELLQKTAALREESANDAQRELEKQIEKARVEQRAMLTANEELSRESSAVDLERLEQELADLLADQQRDAQVLQAWDPGQIEALEALSKQLQEAQLEQSRAERLNAATEVLKASSPGQDPGERTRKLEAAAEAAERAARASGDESAKVAAQALQQAARELREADGTQESAQAAEEALQQLLQGLEAKAAAGRQAAAKARERAQESMAKSSKGKPSNPEGASPFDQAMQDSFPAKQDQALEKAAAEVREALEEAKFLGEALQASQEQNAERAQQLKEALARLPQDLGAEGPEAAEALEQAAQAMRSAADQAQEQAAAPSAESAKKGAEALQKAQSALAKGRQKKANESGSESAQKAAALAEAQSQLAEEVKQLSELAEQASMDEASKEQAQEALKEAAEAMEQAAQEMQQGRHSSAARSQREASESLAKAGQSAKEGVEPQTEEQKAKAEELAAEQEAIQKELYEFKREQEEQGEDAPKLESLSQAQKSAAQAKQSLDQGKLDKAGEQEKQTEQAIQQAIDELKQEEEQYQKLRNEELLFQIAEEIEAVREPHQAAMESTIALHKERQPGAKATRGEKLRLRKISRQEGALQERVGQLQEAIEKENSLVFSELFNRIEQDLAKIKKSMSDAGGYQSGPRVQALQADVARDLGWLAEALAEEEEKEEPKDGEAPPPEKPDGENRLVPDVAELKLLSRMEVDVLDNVEELLVIYPELASGGDIDPLLLEEIQRLGHRHERTTNLFKQFRERLGIEVPPALKEPAKDASGGTETESDTEE